MEIRWKKLNVKDNEDWHRSYLPQLKKHNGDIVILQFREIKHKGYWREDLNAWVNRERGPWLDVEMEQEE